MEHGGRGFRYQRPVSCIADVVNEGRCTFDMQIIDQTQTIPSERAWFVGKMAGEDVG